LFLALVIVGVALVALQQHDTISTYGMLTQYTQVSITMIADQVLLVQHGAVNASAPSGPFRNDQAEELRLDEIIGNFQIGATIYQISNTLCEQNEQESSNIESPSDSTHKRELREILLGSTSAFVSWRIFSTNANQGQARCST
jgi:hypothetical protein